MNTTGKVAALILGSALAGETQAAAPPADVLQRPLIAGASISADKGVSSPGRKLALRFTTADDIRTIAANGRRGAETLRLIRDRDLADRTSVLAIDLFFWDSVRGDTDESVRALKAFMKKIAALNIPVVFGEIPELLPGLQPGAARLNRELAAACQEYPKCRLMPFIRLRDQIARDGHLRVGGRRYSIEQLISDGLHLSDVASDHLADTMSQLLAEIR